jgi:hypothetical protein
VAGAGRFSVNGGPTIFSGVRCGLKSPLIVCRRICAYDILDSALLFLHLRRIFGPRRATLNDCTSIAAEFIERIGARAGGVLRRLVLRTSALSSTATAACAKVSASLWRPNAIKMHARLYGARSPQKDDQPRLRESRVRHRVE